MNSAVFIRTSPCHVECAAYDDAARDEGVAVEVEYHNAILSSRAQVVAQFGKDSNEVRAVGLKKVSEYRKPTWNKAGGDGGGAIV